MIVNEISLVIKNIRVLMSYFPEEDFTVIIGNRLGSGCEE